MPNEYETLKQELFSAKLFKKIKLIKDGEFPKLFKYEADEEKETHKKDFMKIPKDQIAAFEKTKKEAEEFKQLQRATGERAVRKTLEKKVKLSGIDEILAIRQEIKSSKLADEPEKERTCKRKKAHATATEKIRQGSMRAWVDRCYDLVHGVRSKKDDPDIPVGLEPDIRQLLEWDRLPLGLDGPRGDDEVREEESGESLDREPTTEEEKRSSSDETEKILRVKAGASKPPIEEEKEDKKEYESHSEVEVQTKSGVNFVLSKYFIQNLQELRSLAFNEELYAFHPERGIVGSWSVDAKVCETDNKKINVQFEGLLVDENISYAMYAAGLVDRRFNPISEFRVEQVNTPNQTRSKTLFYHKKRSKWLFDLREGLNETETRKTVSQDYNQMLRVLSEGAHILLMRKIVMYYRPFCIEEKVCDFEEHAKNDFCPCKPLSSTCTCKWTESPFALKTRFRLKMRSLSIGGDICRTNYRFFKPVRVTYNGVDLEVVRIRRRVEMPGNLVQVSNYYMTTAGQLMGITFNDPYPFDTPFWLQVDPKAVLDRHRIVSPERIVPLRERYMCDPELKQFYEDEVERLTIVNKTYIKDHPTLRNALKAIFQDLLNDKPHRVVAFIQDFFFEGYSATDFHWIQRLPPGDNSTREEN
ncbi:hypothetical protein GE061_018010 [Apolygus lucorum]|uniref:Uncharacterized protein n=1 Tax=Apolygus lucorum TaxID=248454 RepID=A0A6A4J2Z1_APOLU|nr:hypothetical protein GE061_018010 [Apolygus lucorum]